MIGFITRKLSLLVMTGICFCLLAASTQAQDLLHLARQVTGGPSLHPSKYPQLAKLAREMQKAESYRLPDAAADYYVSPPGVTDYLNDSSACGSDNWADLQMAQNDDGNSNGGGDSSGAADPSDPTQVAFHVMYEWEWQSLSGNEGELYAFKISPFIPIEFANQKFLANFEIPVPAHADLTNLGGFSGIGDTRLKFFWLIPTKSKKVRAIVPSFDAIAPTGDETRGLGGGQWIYMPNLIFALQPAEKLSLYPMFRYVHSDGVATDLVPDLPGLPEAPGNIFATSDIRGFNLEAPIVFGLEDAVMDWVGVTPDFFQNLTGDRQGTLTMKYDSGVRLNDQWFFIAEAWHPVSTRTGNDFTFKLKLDWYPKTGKCRKGRCHQGCRGRCRCR